MLPEIHVYCNRSYTPNEVIIQIGSEAPFAVSMAVYELIRSSLGLPENPCAGLGEDPETV